MSSVDRRKHDDNRALLIEEAIIDAVWGLLLGKVNDLLGDMQFSIPYYRKREMRRGVNCSGTSPCFL
jgi:hypothetical protein